MKRENRRGGVKSVIKLFLIFTLVLTLGVSAFACGKTPPPAPGPGGDGDGDVDPVVESIEISTPPKQTFYFSGEILDTTGMVVKAVWSDGMKVPVSLSDCTVTPTTPLAETDTVLTVEYEEMTATSPITVINGVVAFLTVDIGNTSLKGSTKDTMNLSTIKVTATYDDEDATKREVKGYTSKLTRIKDGEGNGVTADPVVIEDMSAITFNEGGTYTVEITYGEKSDNFEVEVIAGFFFEAEAWKTAETGENDSYVEKVKGAYQNSDDATASGGKYVGSVDKGDIFDFHIYIEEECNADIILRIASGWQKSHGTGGSWHPTEIGDTQFNKLFDISYGTDATSLMPIEIEDDVILQGGKVEEGNTVGDQALWCNWKDVNFSVLPLKKGYNIIRFNVINTTYESDDGMFRAGNVDRLEIKYTDEAPVLVKSIVVSKAPEKVNYIVGETFDSTGMKIRATYSDNSKKEISLSHCTLEPSKPLTKEDDAIIIKYGNFTTSQPITVQDIKSIAVTEEPAKTAYLVGETFDPTGMKITATLDDNTTRAISVSDCTITPDRAFAADDVKVTVTYGGQSVEQAISVVNIEDLTSIQITTAPTKTAYFAGETFNPAGMVITASFTAGMKMPIATAKCTIIPDGALKTSDTAITVTYNGKSATQAVTVMESQIIRIEAENILTAAPGDNSGYIEVVKSVGGGAKAANSEHTKKGENTSGGKILNNVWSGSVIRLHVYSETARKAIVSVHVSSFDYEGGGWSPLHTNNVNFKDSFSLKFGSSADALVNRDPVDFIVKGGDNTVANQDLFELWRAVNLGEFDLVAGDNIIEFTGIGDRGAGANKGIIKIDCFDVIYPSAQA